MLSLQMGRLSVKWLFLKSLEARWRRVPLMWLGGMASPYYTRRTLFYRESEIEIHPISWVRQRRWLSLQEAGEEKGFVALQGKMMEFSSLMKVRSRREQVPVNANLFMERSIRHRHWRNGDCVPSKDWVVSIWATAEIHTGETRNTDTSVSIVGWWQLFQTWQSGYSDCRWRKTWTSLRRNGSLSMHQWTKDKLQ